MLRNRSHVSHVSNFRNRINSSHSQTFTMDSMHRSAEDERLWREQNDGEGEGEEVTASASGNETLDLRNNFKRIETRITADQWNGTCYPVRVNYNLSTKPYTAYRIMSTVTYEILSKSYFYFRCTMQSRNKRKRIRTVCNLYE